MDGRAAGIATIDPSAVLRMPSDPARSNGLAGFIADLRLASAFVEDSAVRAG